MPFTLTNEQYEALVARARKGAPTPDEVRDLDALLRLIEKDNGLSRYELWIQWQETDSPIPPRVEFPERWPPELRFHLELVSRPIARSDVNTVLKMKARRPVNVLVTADPGATYGWTPVEEFFRA